MGPSLGRRRILQVGCSMAGLILSSGCGFGGPSWMWTGRRLPRIGFLKQPPLLDYLDAFREGMREHGQAEGETFLLEYRYVERQNDLSVVAAELARIPVDVFVCPNSAAIDAAIQATSTTPIVFVTTTDPIMTGYVESLNRPGGRLTGPSQLDPGVTGKRLQILSEIAPSTALVGVFWNPDMPSSVSQWLETQKAAEALGLRLVSLEVRQPPDVRTAFSQVVSSGADALFLPVAQVIMAQLPLIARFARDQRLPAISFQREFAEAGGLISYGASIPLLYRRAAYYVDKILRGADPAVLPVEQPTKYDLIINVQAAQAIGLTISRPVLEQATELIQ